MLIEPQKLTNICNVRYCFSKLGKKIFWIWRKSHRRISPLKKTQIHLTLVNQVAVCNPTSFFPVGNAKDVGIIRFLFSKFSGTFFTTVVSDLFMFLSFWLRFLRYFFVQFFKNGIECWRRKKIADLVTLYLKGAVSRDFRPFLTKTLRGPHMDKNGFAMTRCICELFIKTFISISLA